MAILALNLKRISKILLFIGIYASTLRVVHTYPIPMPANQQEILFMLSDKLGIHDPDTLYIYGFAFFDLLIAIVVYRMIMKIWKKFREKSASRRN
ncbi:hypothetical protein AB4851_02995 [Burkholderia sp. 22PA0099]|uniref:hypothetical protein n=1 Tax=Burkholderia sp. 22PA0099 TaxID=3237372 RepID=UPI0039C0C536